MVRAISKGQAEPHPCPKALIIVLNAPRLFAESGQGNINLPGLNGLEDVCFTDTCTEFKGGRPRTRFLQVF